MLCSPSKSHGLLPLLADGMCENGWWLWGFRHTMWGVITTVNSLLMVIPEAISFVVAEVDWTAYWDLRTPPPPSIPGVSTQDLQGCDCWVTTFCPLLRYHRTTDSVESKVKKKKKTGETSCSELSTYRYGGQISFHQKQGLSTKSSPSSGWGSKCRHRRQAQASNCVSSQPHYF